MKLLLVHLS